MKKMILLLLIMITPAFAQSGLAPIKIQSDSARYISGENKSIFEGNVVGTSRDYTLTAEKVTVIANTANEVERIISEKKVNFKSGDIIAVADKAELNQIKKTIVLTGGVKIYKGENYLEGNRVSIQYETQEIEVTGEDRVTIIFNPDSFDNMSGGQP